MLNVVKKWQSVLMVAIFLASSFSLLVTSAPTSMSVIEDGSNDSPLGTIVDNSDMSKIQPSLAEKMFGQQKGMVKVIVPTQDVSELYQLLNGYSYHGLIGDRVGSSGKLAVPTLEVPVSLVTEIASLDSVIGVYDYPATISKDRAIESFFDGEGSYGLNGAPYDGATSVYDAQHHNLEQAWSDGYTGDGVIIGMPDSGVDFGHPDLRGTQARVPALPAKVTGETVVALAETGQANASLAHGNVMPGSETIYLNESTTTAFTIDYATGALTFTTALAYNMTVTADYQYNSPYVGWPMAFDPASLATYLDTGRANGTWYVNTSYTTTAIPTSADVVIDTEAEWNLALNYSIETPSGNTSEEYTLMGFTPGAQFSFAVRAKDEADNVGDISNSPTGVTGIDMVPPGSVMNLTAETSDDHGSVLLNWTSPGDDGDVGTVANYIVKYSTLPISNRVCFDYIDPDLSLTIAGEQPAGGTESRVITGLPPGEQFYFALVAVDEAGNRGELSNCPAPTYVKNDIFPPGAITDLSVSTGLQHREVILTWTAPGDDGPDGTSVDYRIYYSTTPITTQEEFDAALPVSEPPTPQSAGNTETFVLKNTLTAGLTYYFAIEAKDERGQQASLSSGPNLSAVAKQDTIAPGPILDLNAVPGPNHASVRLYWNSTGDDEGVDQATKYIIKYNTVDVFASAATYKQLLVDEWTPKVSGGAEEFVLDSVFGGFISPNTLYYFWVQAVDDGGNVGAVPASASAISTEDTIAPEAINDLTAITADDHGAITLTWTAPHEDDTVGGACKQYVIKHSTTPISDDTGFATAAQLIKDIVPADPGTLETYDFSPSFAPGTTLYFAIKAVDEAGSYGPLDLANLPVSGDLKNDTVAPSKIISLAVATANNDGEVILTWDAPGDDGTAGRASSYIIKYREAVSEYKEVAFEKKQFGVINPTYEDIMYNVTGIPTADGIYHLGIHPDPNLALANGNADMVPPIYNYSRVLLVTDPSGQDTVYVDLDFDQDFTDEKPCLLGDESVWAEWKNEDGDDVIRSGGMIYFISDGTTPIPYSDVYSDRYGLDNIVPGDKEMVCFFGEFGEGAISGTERASVIVGQGKLPSALDEDKRPISQGIAPDAKIMAVTSTMFDGWYFAAEGYDGTPGTGDEAQIVSSGASIDVYENGWDFYSKFLDWLTYVYCDGKISFVAGSGDSPGGGYGFGTINAPGASPAVITVGSGIDYYYRTGLTAPLPAGKRYDGGTSPGYGDIYPTSCRGPTMAGDPKPDIIATGAFTVSSSPINSGTGTDIWMGPGLASSTASGILALVHDAYFGAVHTARKETVLEAAGNTTEAQLYNRPIVDGTLTVWIDGTATTAFSLDTETGMITFDSNVTQGEVVTATYDFTTQFPDVESGRSILMSGADDMNYDPMSQGAGYCNAAESTKIAAATGGVRVTPNRWTPGDYKGTLYDYFIKLYSPETKEENMKKEFTIENHDPFAINANVHASVMEKSGETLFIVQTTKNKQNSWSVLNSNGVFDRDGNMLGSVNSTLWNNAGLLKITASADASELDVNDDGVIDLSYALEIHDWTDRWDIGLSGLFDGDISPDTYAGGEGYWERNRFSSHFPETPGSGLQATIYNPANRSADGLLIWVRGLTGGDVTWYVKCEFYEKSDLTVSEPNIQFYEEDGITTLPTQISIAPGTAYNFIAEMEVPTGTRPGTYECAIYVDKVRTVTDENVIETTKGGENVAWQDNGNIIDCTLSNSSGVIQTTMDAPRETLVNSAYEGQSFALGLEGEGFDFDNVVPGSEDVQKVYDYTYESLTIQSPAQGQLANGNVIGPIELTKNGSFIGDKELVYGPTTAGETGPLYLDHGDVVNCSLYVNRSGVWGLLDGSEDYALNYATGEIDTSGIEPFGDNWVFYAYYNTSYSIALTSPTDYSVDNDTGIIDFTTLLLPNETVVANYSAGEALTLFDDYAINYETGDMRFTIPNVITNESNIYDVGWASNKSFSLNHGNILNCTLYFWNATQGWHKMTISSVAANISMGYYNYTIDYYDGTVEFAKIIIDNKPYATWNLSAGDEIYAFYNYTALNLGDRIDATYSYYPYVINYGSGKISFTEPLDKGDTITATYTYKTTTTIPVVLNVAATDPDFEFGGDNTFDISNESLLMATGGETSARLTYNNIVDGSYDIRVNGESLREYGEVSGQELLNNSNTVADEIVLIADGGETTADLEHTGVLEEIASGSFILYYNGSKLNGTVEGEPYDNATNDYTLNLTTGHIVFSPGKPLPGGLKPGANITADYSYYDPTITSITLPEGKIVPDSYVVYENGLVRGETLYEVNLTTGKITFKDKYGQVTQIGLAIITVDYSFGNYEMNRITGEVSFSVITKAVNETFAPMATAGKFSLQNRNIISPADIKSLNYMLYFKNATHWQYMDESETDGMFNYSMDHRNGTISLNNWTLEPGDSVHATYYYTGLKPGDVVTADYQYRDGNKRLFSTDAVYGGGDWRFYYVEIPDGGLNKDPLTKFFVNLTWDNRLADIDVITFGPSTPGNSAPGNYDFSSDRYGPQTLQNNGGSTETAAFFTATGGPQEYSMSDLSPGLNIIGLHSTLMTASNFESIRGQVGNIKISVDEIKVVSNEYSGSFNLSTVCSMDLPGQLGGVAAGPSAPVKYTDMPVYQDDPDWENYDSFQDQLASGNTSIYVTLKDCLIFDIHIYGHDNALDLDLGIFLDENGDGITQVEEFAAFDADGDADEHVKLIAPKDGDYIIRIYGFTLTTIPAQFDIDITTVQGLGFTVNGKGENTSPDENNIFSSDTTLPAHTIGEVELSWDLPGVKEGVPLMGAMYIGPGNGPMTFLMAIDLGFDFTEPTISGLTPGEGDIMSDKIPSIGVTFEDLDRGELVASSIELYLDGMDITAQSSINVPFDDENAGGGHPMGTVSYTLPGPLEDGVHIIEAHGNDLAGNVAETSWSFTVDTAGPSLSITEPSEAVSYTSSDNFVIAGEYEIDTSLVITGTDINKLDKKQDGTFRAEVTLENGVNLIIISATDEAGNKAEIKRTIILDTSIPSFEGFTSEQGSRTNKDKVRITGEVNERGTLTINSQDTPVNSDGSFSNIIDLNKGENTLHLIFTDMAGNEIHDWMNITLDQTMPEIVLADLPTLVHSNNFTFSAQITEDELEIGGVRVNGKQVTVTETRGVSEFDRTVFLSHGLNTIVIEVTDKAGNVVELRHTVEYTPETGTNYGAIGVMIILLIVGLLVGLFIAMVIWKEKPEEDEPEEVMADEDEGIEKPEDDDAEPIEDEGIEPVEGEEIPLDGEEVEAIPEEEMSPEEIGDSVIDEQMPDEEFEAPDDEPGDGLDDELSDDAMGDEVADMPEDDMEEMASEEGSADIGTAIANEGLGELPEEEVMETGSDESEMSEPEMDAIEAEAHQEELEAESGEFEEDGETEVPDDLEDDDPRIAKLRQALEDGKISQELFDKNIARLKGD